MIFEGVEARGPELPEGPQPVVERGQVARFETIEPALAVGPHAHQARFAQELEVLGDARLAEAGGLHQVAGRQLAGPQQVQQAAAVGLGDGFPVAMPSTALGLALSTSATSKAAVFDISSYCL